MELQPIRNAPASPGTGVLLALQRDGVPAEDAPKVKELQTLLAADIETYGDAALSDATTLLRFLRAREHDVAAAAERGEALRGERRHEFWSGFSSDGTTTGDVVDDIRSIDGNRKNVDFVHARCRRSQAQLARSVA